MVGIYKANLLPAKIGRSDIYMEKGYGKARMCEGVGAWSLLRFVVVWGGWIVWWGDGRGESF